jgi:hypothetical protein
MVDKSHVIRAFKRCEFQFFFLSYLCLGIGKHGVVVVRFLK